MDNISKPPLICEHTVEYLDKLFPEMSASAGDTLETIWQYSGKREVVRHLKTLIERQKKSQEASEQLESPFRVPLNE